MKKYHHGSNLHAFQSSESAYHISDSITFTLIMQIWLWRGSEVFLDGAVCLSEKSFGSLGVSISFLSLFCSLLFIQYFSQWGNVHHFFGLSLLCTSKKWKHYRRNGCFHFWQRCKEGSWPRLKINATFFYLHNQHKSIPFSNRECPEEPVFGNNVIYEPSFWIFIFCFSILYFLNILWKCRFNIAMLTNCK